jgi:16S rRNA C967 or C1407 C5-methylase (RsmB/RsmF family)
MGKTEKGENSRFIGKVSARLFDTEVEREEFLDALLSPKPLPGAVVWLREKPQNFEWATEAPLDFQPEFVDRLPAGSRPGQNPLHDEGYYYALDFSSVATAAPLCDLEIKFPSVFDMCAAPGGKAIFAHRALEPSILYCNEAIRKRAGALISNLKRCQIPRVSVYSADSAFFVANCAGTMDVVIVDAPCSGQSLIAKGEKSPGCFHPSTINLNSNRQKRIAANSAKLVAEGGYLLYMTCTYSVEENEEVIQWLMKRFPAFTPVEIPRLASIRSHVSEFPSYRILPQTGIGAGGFAALLRNEAAPAECGSFETVRAIWSAD